MLLEILVKLKSSSFTPDIIILLQPTAPFRITEDINICIDKLKNSKRFKKIIQPEIEIYFSKINDLFAIMGRFL